MKYLISSLFLILAVCTVGGADGKSATTSPTDFLHYEPSIVRLEGVVQSCESYGAPNYDSTSPKEKWYYLQLKEPMNVIRDKTDAYNPENTVTEKNVKNVQLVLSYKGCKNLLGKTIIMEGKLFHSFTGHHHTRILMTPNKIYCLMPDRDWE